VELSSLTNPARRPPHAAEPHFNGGFPEPPFGMPVRVVGAAHEACGLETRVRIPGAMPPQAVRRVVCDHCARPFECEAYDAPGDGGGWLHSLPDLRGLVPGRPGFLDAPPGRIWRWLSVPIAAAAVIAGLILIQGGDDSGTRQASPALAASDSPGKTDAELVSQPGWTMALPDGWTRGEGPSGSAYAAESADGTADVTLWIEKDPDLSFDEFTQRSLDQLTQLAGSAEIVEQTSGPTLEKTRALLEANAPEGSGTSAPYTVTLHASGPYRYYLSTAVQPGGTPDVIQEAKLIHSSFVPVPGEEPTAVGTP
jgi:hypothetical protein